LNAGKLLQVGTPTELYRHPQARFVAEFIGEGNFLTGRVLSHNDLVEIELGNRNLFVQSGGNTPPNLGSSVALCLRPEIFQISELRPPGQAWQATLLETAFLGPVAQHRFRCGEDVLEVAEFNPRPGRFRPGDECFLGLNPEDIILLNEK
jgi:spermidine/putrescine transport system ATP-binding protein